MRGFTLVLFIPQVSKLLHHRSAAAVYMMLLSLSYMACPLLLATRNQPEEVSERDEADRQEMYAFVVIYHSVLTVSRSLVFK